MLPAPARRSVKAPAGPTFEQKMAWILGLEDQRMLRDPAPAPAAARAAACSRESRSEGRSLPWHRPAAAAAAQISSRLLSDGEARIRRRAALAIGRVRTAPTACRRSSAC